MFILSIFFFALAVSIGGMGMGDVKMAIGLGFFFGWQLVLLVAFLAFLIGGVFAIFLALRLMLSRRYRPRIAIPFGPYLALASVITLFYGQRILEWYLSFFRVA
jgi:prepilin signal peptidase PulO-like enzyme (type II secretory pathway)